MGKEYVKAVYCHPAYLTYIQSTSCKTLGWKKHNLESRLPGEISIDKRAYKNVHMHHGNEIIRRKCDVREGGKNGWDHVLSGKRDWDLLH